MLPSTSRRKRAMRSAGVSAASSPLRRAASDGKSTVVLAAELSVARIRPPPAPRRSCRSIDRRDDIAAVDEHLVVERDADRLSGERLVRYAGLVRHRPRLDRLHPCLAAARHDGDLVTDADAAGLHPSGDDT